MANYFDIYTLDNLLDEMEAVYLNDERPWILVKFNQIHTL